MESRFTFKDFVFVVLFLVVIGAVVWMSRQFNYNEERLTDVKKQLVRMGDDQKQQLEVLSDIRNALRAGVRVESGGASTQANGAEGSSTQANGRIRRTNPDGSLYVYYPEAPASSGRDPRGMPGYTTGDWLVQDVGSEPKLIAPLISDDVPGQMVQQPVLEGLVTVNDETFEVEPLLAESYWVSADGLTLRFKLRSNVCFSDGTPVTVEDVLFSYKTLMDTSVDAAPMRSSFDNVKDCKKVDDRTVQFDMVKPYFLSVPYVGGMTIIPEHVYKYQNGDEYNKRGGLLVGTGAYRVDRWDRGQQIVLVRNERYWGKPATFDRLIYKFFTNEQAALQAFQDGQIDRFEPVGDQYAKFSADPEFLKSFKPYKFLRVNSGFGFIGWNLKKPMFKDKETRRALTMLLDRRAMIDTLNKGMGEMEAGPFNPMSPQHDPSVQPVPYDPEGAKKLLATAGWTAGSDGVLIRDGVRFEFSLLTPAGSPQIERNANYIKNQFASAGIRMQITPTEFSVMQTQIDDRKFDALTMAWFRGTTAEDDPFQIWDSASMKDKGSNSISWDNKESDRLIETARTTIDPEKRQQLWREWEKLIVDEQPYTFLWARMDRMFVNGRFRNTDPYKLDVIPYDWYVPAALQKYH